MTEGCNDAILLRQFEAVGDLHHRLYVRRRILLVGRIPPSVIAGLHLRNQFWINWARRYVIIDSKRYSWVS